MFVITRYIAITVKVFVVVICNFFVRFSNMNLVTVWQLLTELCVTLFIIGHRLNYPFFPGLSSGPKLAEDDSDEDNDSDVDKQQGKNEQFQEEDFKIDPRDESAFNAFMNTNVEPRKTLADLVWANINVQSILVIRGLWINRFPIN